MKRLLWILPLLLLLTTCNQPYRASRAPGNLWYIATAANGGSDTDGDGSLAHPWLTLKHASDTIKGVAFVGDTIVFGAGTFTETAQSTVDPQVSLLGAGADASIIKSAVSDTLILCVSDDGTYGNQSISNLYFEGDNYTGGSAIAIYNRSNFKIHHCTFNKFAYDAVLFRGDTEWGNPVICATGNEFHDNIVYDCAGYWSTYGNLEIGGQKDILIYNNTITSVDRGTNLWGFCIKFDGGGYNMGVQIYKNTLISPAKNGSNWSFAIELFDSRGGIVVRDNIIQGTVDFSANSGGITNDAGGYGFALKIYNNIITYPAGTNDYIVGIDLERSFAGGTYIYNNRVSNFSVGLSTNVAAGEAMRDIWIYYNIFDNIGRSSSTTAYGMEISNEGTTFDNINILNNVIDGKKIATKPNYGIRLLSTPGSNITIRNNIISGFSQYVITWRTSTIDILSVENNNFYNNGNSNEIYSAEATITNSTVQNNLTSDPLFRSTSDLHLQSTSPAINAGTPVGLTTDFAGHRVPQQDTVDIGAYEYGNYLSRTPSGHLLRNANGKFMISH